MNIVKFKKYKYHIFLFLIVFILFLANYKSGTYLSGWDNLQTELNPGLAIKRAFFSVWQEYQSFGLLAGMAHASDLIRSIFLWFVSFVMPQNIIRYFYHFLMLWLGSIGIFKLLKSHLELVSRSQNKFGTTSSNIERPKLVWHDNWIAFLGALFYILNLGTVQIFYLPFEPFSTFFAFLPWAIWIFLSITYNVERETYKKNLLLFFFINILGTPSFYVQQLFIVYLLILATIFLGVFANSISNTIAVKIELIKKGFLALFFILIINSFWLLPQLYFLKTSSNVVYEAKANQLATDDVYYQNKEKGALFYFLKLEGFYFDLFGKNNLPLFLPWKNHFKIFSFLQYFFAIICILGLFNSIKKKNFLFVFYFFLVSIFFLNATWPINLIDENFRKFRLLNQIFRSPFTKFIIPYSLVFSYFFAFGVDVLTHFFKQLQKKFFIFYILFFILIIIYSLPAFQGYFISSEMKVKIPTDYFQVIDYFKTIDKNKRIALLPDYTFWGWFFHKWGYNGSGFLWYGIEQPIVSRTFDVWSDKSESYFWEMKAAAEAEDLTRFEKNLEKYSIDYLLIDYSLIPVVGTIKGLQYDRINQLLAISKKISLIRKWSNIALYKVNQNKDIKDFIFIKNNLPSIGPKIKLTDNDKAYFDLSDYYFDQKKVDAFYPFLDLTTQTRLKNKNWQTKETDDKFLITVKSEVNFSNYKINYPQNSFQAVFYKDDKLATYSGSFDLRLTNNHQLQLAIDKVLIQKVNVNNLHQEECAKNTLCISFSLPYLSQKYGYLIKIKNKNIAGRRLYFYVLDQTKKQSYLEERLQDDEEFFILPPKYQYGLGYSIVFHNNSYKNLKSENKLIDLEFYLFPYDNLKSLYLTSPQFYLLNNRVQDSINFSAKKINYFTYQVSNIQIANNQSPITIILPQSYHSGWKAYILKNPQFPIFNFQFLAHYLPFLFGQELKEHFLVNNWANAWRLEETPKSADQTLREPSTNSSEKANGKLRWRWKNNSIIIIFLPQYLEFIGLFLLILCFFFLILYKPNPISSSSNFN